MVVILVLEALGGGFKCHKNFGNKNFENIFSIQNLYRAWFKFSRGKRKKQDILSFCKDLTNNLLHLSNLLKTRKYKHGLYKSFYVYDPKKRHIHKATVKDRVIHQLLVNILEPIFEPKFIFDSYSSRINKGTHRAVKRFQIFARKVSRNYTENCFVLKCDVRKFFDSINHEILTSIIRKTIRDGAVLWLIDEILRSFEIQPICGLPLGNVTSQLFANIYLNELDHFVKRTLHVKYYIRYCDDFVILDGNENLLKRYILEIQEFLKQRLGLQMHPKKVIIRKYSQGVDFLGYTCLPHYALPKTKTRRRIVKKIKKRINEFKKGLISEQTLNQSIQSYFGFLKHASSHKLVEDLKNKIWFWTSD